MAGSVQLVAMQRDSASEIESFGPQISKEKTSEIFRWPPLGISTIATCNQDGSHIGSETDRHPRPFIGREHRVNRIQWQEYLRVEARRYKPRKKPDGKQAPQANGQNLEQPPTRAQGRRISRFPVDPIGRFAITWRIAIVILDATYSAFLVPLGIAFHWNANTFSWYNGIDFVGGGMYWFDIFMGFGSGYVAVYNLKRMIVTNPRLVARYYIRHGTFMWDLPAALPVIAEIVVLCKPTTLASQDSLHGICLLRLFRLARVFKTAEWIISKSLAGQFHHTLQSFLTTGQVFLLSILFSACVFINLLACMWYYVASWEGVEHSWLSSIGSSQRDISGQGPVRAWVAAVFFVCTTITTTGYGDITPANAAEELVASLIMLIGVVAFGFIITGSQQIVEYLMPRARDLGLLRDKLEEANSWCDDMNLSACLRGRLNAYYTEVWLPRVEWHESSVYDELPAVLRAEICLEKTNYLLASHRIFRDLDRQAYMMIANRLTAMTIHAGHDLCKEGHIAECFWILEEGEVLAIKKGRETELLKEPALLGECAVLADVLPSCRKHTATYRAVTPCAVWRMNRVDMDHIFYHHPGVLDSILQHFRDHCQYLLREHHDTYNDEGWHELVEQIHDSEAAANIRRRRLNNANPFKLPEE